MSSTIRGTHDRVATVIATQGDLRGENRVLTTMQYTTFRTSFILVQRSMTNLKPVFLFNFKLIFIWFVIIYLTHVFFIGFCMLKSL